MAKKIRTWDEVSAGAGREDMPLRMLVQFPNLSQAERRKALHDAWIMPERPLLHLDADTWKVLFEGALDEGDFILGTDEGRYADLPEEVTLYRGAVEEHALAMSWTSKPRMAAWFAEHTDMRGYDGTGYVWQASIAREDVLAHFPHGRNEDEYVCRLDGWEIHHLTRLTPEQACTLARAA